MSEQFAPFRARLLHDSNVVALPQRVPAGAPGRRSIDGPWPAARAVCDLLALFVATSVGGALQAPGLGAGWNVVVIMGTLAAFASAGLYAPRLRLQFEDELRRGIVVSALVTLGVTAVALLTSGRTGIGDAAVVQWLVASAAICTARAALYGGQRARRRRTGSGRRTLIVGAGEIGHLTARRLLDDPVLGLRPIGFLDKEPLAQPRAAPAGDRPTLPVLGASWDLEQVVEEHGVEHVVVAFSTAPAEVMVDLVRRSWKLGLDVFVIPRLFEVEGRRVRTEHLGALPLVGLWSADPQGWQFAVKYATDRLTAALALLLLSPALAVVALTIRLSMGGPVLFRQQRVGRDGRSFEILKFRTMNGAPEHDGEANAGWASLILAGTGIDSAAAVVAPVNRCTPLGSVLRRFSLDELPQLWNVVRGDMSLVGPRPELPHYVERFEGAIDRYPERHRVKSGLTGWAQVHGLRGDTSLSDRIEWDNFYIENWTPWLDLKIVLLTLPALLGRRRAQR